MDQSVSFLPCSFNRFSDEKAIYTRSGDNRKNLYEEGINEDIKRQALSVACLIEVVNITSNNPGHYQLKAKTLNQRLVEHQSAKNADVHFGGEPSIGFGTAFLVGSKLALTAAHCVCKEKTDQLNLELIGKTRLVFGFCMQTAEKWQDNIEDKYVYEIDHVVHHKYETRKCDWALVELKKNVSVASPLEVDFTNIIGEKLGIYMLGHPYGLPMKFVDDGEIKENHPGDGRTQAEIVAYQGNSGSPVFSKTTNKVIGILIGGNKDYSIAQNTVKDYQVTSEDIQKSGHEKLQKTSAITDDLVEKVDQQQAVNRKKIDDSCNKVVTDLEKGGPIEQLDLVLSNLEQMGGGGFLPALHLLSQLFNNFKPKEKEKAKKYFNASIGYTWPTRQIRKGDSSSAFSILHADAYQDTIADAKSSADSRFSEVQSKGTQFTAAQDGGASKTANSYVGEKAYQESISRGPTESNASGSRLAKGAHQANEAGISPDDFIKRAAEARNRKENS